ncbi:hypothetical protein H0A36_18770 [Endozoicomonas sp. SM1973]|uniref:Uncharacterized protein n=1 Tax=Spartinivicinus marinus TaxID=2994442 RepID=A0A853I8L9_9GAMM|nr:hypothetical protein [Spartinivicinus marinus]MCX4029731.1 hypothetical protein [Spartinivicinus marinus]NYZ68062.1 hypothetical protein [Spartinivicinus marinus]
MRIPSSSHSSVDLSKNVDSQVSNTDLQKKSDDLATNKSPFNISDNPQLESINSSLKRLPVYGNTGILDAYNQEGHRTHFRVNNKGQLEYWRSDAKKHTPFGLIKLKAKFKPVQQVFADGKWPVKGKVDALIPGVNGGALALIEGKLYQLSTDGFAKPWDKANVYGDITNAFVRNDAVIFVLKNGTIGRGAPGSDNQISRVASPSLEQPLQAGDQLFIDNKGVWWKFQAGELARHNPTSLQWQAVSPQTESINRYDSVVISESGQVFGFFQENNQPVQEDVITGKRLDPAISTQTVDGTLRDAFTFHATADNGQQITLGAGLDKNGQLTGYIEAPGNGQDKPAQRLAVLFPDGNPITGIQHLRAGKDGTLYFVRAGNVYSTSVAEGQWTQPQEVYKHTSNTQALDVAVARDGKTAILLSNGTLLGAGLPEPLAGNYPEGQLSQLAYDSSGSLWAITDQGGLLKFDQTGKVVLSSKVAAEASGTEIPVFKQLSTAAKDGLIRLIDSNGKGYFIGSTVQSGELANALATSQRPNLPGKGQVVRVPGGKWTETFLGLLPGGHTVSGKTDKFATVLFKEKLNRRILSSIREYMAAHIKTPVQKGVKGLWRKIQNAVQADGPMFKEGGSGSVYQEIKRIVANNASFQGNKVTLRNTDTSFKTVIDENAKIVAEIKQLINYDELTRPENGSFLNKVKGEVQRVRKAEGFDANNLIFQLAESPVLDQQTRQFMYELLDLGVFVDRSAPGGVLQAKLLQNADTLRQLHQGETVDIAAARNSAISKAYAQGFRSLPEMYNLEKAVKGLSGDLQNPDSELSKAWREVTGVAKSAGQEALVAAIKNKIAALPVGESLTLSRSRGVEVSLTGKRAISRDLNPASLTLYAGPKGHWKIAPSLTINKKADGSIGISISYSRDAGAGIGAEFIAGTGVAGGVSVSAVLGAGIVGNQVRSATFGTTVGNQDDFITKLTGGDLSLTDVRAMSNSAGTVARKSVVGVSASAYVNGGVNAPALAVLEDTPGRTQFLFSVKPVRAEGAVNGNWASGATTGANGVEGAHSSSSRSATVGYGIMPFYSGVVFGQEDADKVRPLEPYYKKIRTLTVLSDSLAINLSFEADTALGNAAQRVKGITVSESLDPGALAGGKLQEAKTRLTGLINRNPQDSELQASVETVLEAAKQGSSLSISYELTTEGVRQFNQEGNGQQWLKRLHNESLTNPAAHGDLIRIKSVSLSKSASHGTSGGAVILAGAVSSGTINESVSLGTVSFKYDTSHNQPSLDKRSGALFVDSVSGVTPGVNPGGKIPAHVEAFANQISQSGRWNYAGADVAPLAIAKALGVTFDLEHTRNVVDTLHGGRNLRGKLIHSRPTNMIDSDHYLVRGRNGRVYSMPADGDCLFHAINFLQNPGDYQISADKPLIGQIQLVAKPEATERIQLMRNQVADWVRANPGALSDLIQSDIVASLGDLRGSGSSPTAQQYDRFSQSLEVADQTIKADDSAANNQKVRDIDNARLIQYTFDQSKRMLSVGKQHGLSVELSPAVNKKQNTLLADVLSMANALHQEGDVKGLLASKSQSRFVSELIKQNKNSAVETAAYQRYSEAQSDIVQAAKINKDYRVNLGEFGVAAIAEKATAGGDQSLIFRSGRHRYLVANNKGKLSFYDPAVGWVSGFKNKADVVSFLNQYFSDSAQLNLGINPNQFQVQLIQDNFYQDARIAQATQQLQQSLPVELERLSNQDLQQGLLKVNGQQVSRTQLWLLGAQINGQPIAADRLVNGGVANLKFNSEVLQQFLSTAPQADFAEGAKILKTLAQLQDRPVAALIDGDLSSRLQTVVDNIDKAPSALTDSQVQTLQNKLNGNTTRVSVKGIASQVPGVGLQAWGIYSGIKAADAAFEKGDIQEGVIQTGSVLANIASIPAEIALNRSLPKLSQRLIARSVSSSSRLATSSASRLGQALGRSGGALAALITLPFDIYTAAKAFSDAQGEGLTDKQRQDLYVQGGFAVAGAVTALSLGVAAIFTGSAALGPIGLGISVGLIVGAQIYSAVRQVEDAWEYVPELDDWRHRLRQGWLAFWGQDMDEWVTDAFKANKTQHDVIEQTRQRSAELLQGELGNVVDTIVYGDIDVAIEDVKVYHYEGGYETVREPKVNGADDVIFAQNGLQGIKNAVSANIDPEKAVLFNIGGGSDTVFGVTNKKNEFIFGKGAKNLKGGNLNDNFMFSVDFSDMENFYNNLDNYKDRIFFEIDGQGGDNTLTINAQTYRKYTHTEQAYSGFIIDLEQGKVWLKNTGKTGDEAKGPQIGELKNIQHTLGSGSDGDATSSGSDYIIGTNDSNRILANKGDQVFAKGGNDVITLSDYAKVDGGDGQDIYLIKRDARDVHITENGQDASVVRLEFALDEIADWQLVNKNIVIRLKEAGTVTVHDIYTEYNNQWQLKNNQISFQSHDGFMLMPNLPAQRQALAVDQAESIQLHTRYLKAGDRTYFNQQTGVTIDLNDNRIDGNNQGGVYQQDEFEKLDKTQLIVLQGDDDHQNAPAGARYFIERGAGENVIKPQAQDRKNPVTNKVFLDYDATEITAIETRYRNETYSAGYRRKDYSLVVSLSDGRQVILENIIDTTLHVYDALARGGETLRDFVLVTRDGIEYSLKDYGGSKTLATESHYHGKNNNGTFLVDTHKTLNQKDYKLSDWQWGEGKKLDARYQLSAEGTAYADTLIGNEQANVLRGYGGDDLMQGNDGHDTYVIGAFEGTVTINNQATDNKIDNLVIGAGFNDITSRRDGMNLVLNARLPRPTEVGGVDYINRQVVIENYFVSDTFRHLSIVSNEGLQQELVVDELGNISRIIGAKALTPQQQQLLETDAIDERLLNRQASELSVAEKIDYSSHQQALNVLLDSNGFVSDRFRGTAFDDVVSLTSVGKFGELILEYNPFKVIPNIDLGAGNNTLDLSQLAASHIDAQLIYGSSIYVYDDSQDQPQEIRINNIANIIGTAGNDKLTGYNGGNKLLGGAGDDIIDGKEGANTLVGGKGNDQIYSGSDQDKIIYRKGDGRDTINGNTVNDVLLLKDISLYDLHFSLTDKNTLLISFKGQPNDQIEIVRWQASYHFNLVAQDGIIDKRSIDQLIPALASINPNDWANGSASLNHSQQTQLANSWTVTAAELKGDDNQLSVLIGRQGDDQLTAGLAGSIVRGGDGNDTLIDNMGNDLLNGEKGNDIIKFIAAGEDIASGGEGSDTYQVSTSSRGLKIIDNQANSGDDILVLDQVDSFENLQLARQGQDLHLLVKSKEGQLELTNTTEVVVKNFYLSDAYQHLSLILADGNEVLATDLAGMANLAPPRSELTSIHLTAESNSLKTDYRHHQGLVSTMLDNQLSDQTAFYGSDYSDTLKVQRFGEISTIDLGKGVNTIDLSQQTAPVSVDLNGQAGRTAATLHTEESGKQANITLKGVQHVVGSATATNALVGNSQRNILIGGHQADQLFAVAGENTLEAGKGNDTIVSGSGKDTIIFNSGDGRDSLSGNTTGDALVLKNISLHDVHFSLQDNNQLNISFKGSTQDKVIVKQWNNNQAFNVVTDNGVIDKSGIEQLIQALSGFTETQWSQGGGVLNNIKEQITSSWVITQS